MSTWKNAVLTAQGANLLAKLAAGNTLAITKAYTGTNYVNPDDLSAQTTIEKQVQALELKPVTLPGNGQCVLPMTITNTGLTSGYTATQVGVFAKDPTAGDVLLFIAQAEEGAGTEIPSESEMPGYSAEWRFYVNYGQADGVTVAVTATGTVTEAEFETHTGDFNNPHKVTAAQVGLGNVDNTSDASKPISDATQSALAQKADAGALTGHVNARNNPHGVTAAQVGLGNVDNTSDANKPVSTAMQAALNGKQKTISMGTAAPSGGSNGDIYIQY